MKLIILDRDGVINQDSDAFIKSPDEWIPIKGSLEAIARLNQAGYRVVVATNQSGVARGLFDIKTLNAIHQKMHTAAQQAGADIDAVFFCPHSADDNCDCRKPKPGMLLDAAGRHGINLAASFMVGDRAGDIGAGHAAGCRAIFINRGYSENAPSSPDAEVASLAEAVEKILEFSRNSLCG